MNTTTTMDADRDPGSRTRRHRMTHPSRDRPVRPSPDYIRSPSCAQFAGH